MANIGLQVSEARALKQKAVRILPTAADIGAIPVRVSPISLQAYRLLGIATCVVKKTLESIVTNLLERVCLQLLVQSSAQSGAAIGG